MLYGSFPCTKYHHCTSSAATRTGWLWLGILKAQRSRQKSMFSEENSPLPHVHKLTALPEAPWWIWGSQKPIQWCWLHAVLEWGDISSSAFNCSVEEYLTPSLSQLCFGESLGIFICFVTFMTPHSAMIRYFPVALYNISPCQPHGKGAPHSQKL